VNANTESPAAPSTMAMLDPTTLLWSEPNLNDPNIPKLVYHSATAIYKYMIVAFGKLTYSKKNLQILTYTVYLFYLGNLTDGTNDDGVPNDKFYLFTFTDPEKVTWSNLTAEQLASYNLTTNLPFIPSPSPKNPNTPKSSTNSLSTTAISLIIVVGIASIVTFTLI
jgi:hypothetical protein